MLIIFIYFFPTVIVYLILLIFIFFIAFIINAKFLRKLKVSVFIFLISFSVLFFIIFFNSQSIYFNKYIKITSVEELLIENVRKNKEEYLEKKLKDIKNIKNAIINIFIFDKLVNVSIILELNDINDKLDINLIHNILISEISFLDEEDIQIMDTFYNIIR